MVDGPKSKRDFNRWACRVAQTPCWMVVLNQQQVLLPPRFRESRSTISEHGDRSGDTLAGKSRGYVSNAVGIDALFAKPTSVSFVCPLVSDVIGLLLLDFSQEEGERKVYILVVDLGTAQSKSSSF